VYTINAKSSQFLKKKMCLGFSIVTDVHLSRIKATENFLEGFKFEEAFYGFSKILKYQF
jgi:hypothetical protein